MGKKSMEKALGLSKEQRVTRALNLLNRAEIVYIKYSSLSKRLKEEMRLDVLIILDSIYKNYISNGIETLEAIELAINDTELVLNNKTEIIPNNIPSITYKL